MRKPRKFLKSPERIQYFHVTSRIVNGDQVIGSKEKDFFLTTMRKLESFSGIEIITYCLMDNHFHLLLKVPTRIHLSDESIIKRMKSLYSKAKVDQFKEELSLARKNGKHDLANLITNNITRRMFDLSMFMKDLKQRFTQWFNRQHSRRGTLWEERFRCVLLEGSRHTLMTTGAYIDLNPIRAGLCSDPKEYPYSGYGEAMKTKRIAQERLALFNTSIESPGSGSIILKKYRAYLYSITPQTTGNVNDALISPTFDRQKALKELSRSSKLSLWQLLRCRVRYFTSGTVLGSRSFVDSFFLEKRSYFGPHRTSGARSMKGGDWCGIYTLRNLALRVYD